MQRPGEERAHGILEIACDLEGFPPKKHRKLNTPTLPRPLLPGLLWGTKGKVVPVTVALLSGQRALVNSAVEESTCGAGTGSQLPQH